MHNASHPEVEERARGAGTAQPTPESQPTPPEAAPGEESDRIRSSVMAAMESDGISLARLSKMLSYSTSVLSQYLAGKYPGDREKVEHRLSDWLRSRARRKNVGVKLIECDASEAVMGALDTIRRTNDFGVIHGDAGIGKSSGIELYLDDYPTSILISLASWARNAAAVESLIFEVIGHGGWHAKKRDERPSRGQFIADKLRGSNRLLIVDNAHKATPRALESLFDLHSETKIPVALVGNREVLAPIEANDQRYSRVGLNEEIKLSNPRKLIRHLVATLAPGFAGLIEDRLEKIARQQGRFRAVAKTLILAAQLQEGSGKSPVEAILTAHSKLVRSYALD